MRRATREIIDSVLHVHVGGVPILSGTRTLNSACDVNAMCMSHALMMVLVSPVFAPHLSRSLNRVERFVHSTLRGSLAAFGLSTKME